MPVCGKRQHEVLCTTCSARHVCQTVSEEQHIKWTFTLWLQIHGPHLAAADLRAAAASAAGHGLLQAARQPRALELLCVSARCSAPPGPAGARTISAHGQERLAADKHRKFCQGRLPSGGLSRSCNFIVAEVWQKEGIHTGHLADIHIKLLIIITTFGSSAWAPIEHKQAGTRCAAADSQLGMCGTPSALPGTRWGDVIITFFHSRKRTSLALDTGKNAFNTTCPI